jgi:hypothetical protein
VPQQKSASSSQSPLDLLGSIGTPPVPTQASEGADLFGFGLSGSGGTSSSATIQLAGPYVPPYQVLSHI